MGLRGLQVKEKVRESLDKAKEKGGRSAGIRWTTSDTPTYIGFRARVQGFRVQCLGFRA